MRKLLFLSLCVLFFLGCTTPKESKKGPELFVGVSKAFINPPLGAFIAGDKQNRVFTGVLDSLYAKAVVLYDGEKALALVTVDCIGLLYPELQKVREAVALMPFDIPFSPENIVISSTHTHSGPDVVGIWGKDYSQSGRDPEYMDFLVQTISAQILEASKSLQPVSARFARASFGESWVENICGEEIDREVTSIRFVDQEEKTVASLTNFACHPTHLDAVFSEISADYLAGFYKAMEKNWGGEHLFLQGAIGGWVQPKDKADYQIALQRGSDLAETVINAHQKETPLQSDRIFFSRKTILFPVENEAWKALAAGGIFDRNIGEMVESEVTWFGIGEATFATHPGESTPFHSLETKKMMPEGPKFVLGLGQDALGYILKPSYFEDPMLPHAAYLTRTSLGKNTAETMMQAISELSQSTKK
ncbi:neutral/alkaline non-lysosomal ceramidase N-terminal domain-containing protein [Mariniradius sediminis]|uniref:Neutral ceramidase n=1 Tax=Mariniradius sediminis TaxID=2909237 RepID=A0ABS9BPM8_9BACT|nr:neutral/alkaline non-lysosomal ceramidase N-terminal domain-containing protein [Mariniradius sediminis]MCF1750010.1 neutral/alkaline non-lysosomal ceramidase N-terminal domain-containing protein [Mariniradius sediminis]